MFDYSNGYIDKLHKRIAELSTSLDTARKALERVIKTDYVHNHQHCACYLCEALARISNPSAYTKFPICETSCKPCTDHPKHIALEERDRAVAKRCIEIIHEERTWLDGLKAIRREFGL